MVASKANRNAEGKLNREDHVWRRLPVEDLWPPKEWPQFAGVTNTNKVAFSNSSLGPELGGAGFSVDAFDSESLPGEPLFKIAITEWLYTASRGPVHRPVLELLFSPKKAAFRTTAPVVQKLKVLSRSVEGNDRMAARAVAAAAQMMKEIQAGSVPDSDQVLRDYLIHPLQNNFSKK